MRNLLLLFCIGFTLANNIEAHIKLRNRNKFDYIYFDKIKYQDFKNFYVSQYNPESFAAYKYDSHYYLSLSTWKSQKDMLYIFNPIDSSLKCISNFQFSSVDLHFTYKDDVYFIVTEPSHSRKKYITLLQIKKNVPDTVNNYYSFKLLGSSRIEDEDRTNDFGTNITTDSSGNLKIKVLSYDKTINWWNILFFWCRGFGSMWEYDPDTEVEKWYVFDDNLNLLYTEDVPNRKKTRE